MIKNALLLPCPGYTGFTYYIISYLSVYKRTLLSAGFVRDGSRRWIYERHPVTSRKRSRRLNSRFGRKRAENLWAGILGRRRDESPKFRIIRRWQTLTLPSPLLRPSVRPVIPEFESLNLFAARAIVDPVRVLQRKLRRAFNSASHEHGSSFRF